MRTNTPPTGAFRGCGGPQSEFAMDMLMSHIADELGVDELEFKLMHMAEKGKCTPTGAAYYYDVPLPRMLEMAEKATDYSVKRACYARIGSGILRQGIGIAFGNHGAPLGGDTEWKYLKPKVRMKKTADGSVEIFTGQTELGQGIRTAFCKIAATALEIPFEKVSTPYPNLDITADTGPTAASRSVISVGKVVESAVLELKKIWKDGEEQEVVAEYRRPEHGADFDASTMTGVQYDDWSWSVVVVEVLVDILTGNIQIKNAHGVYNLGTPIDENILTGAAVNYSEAVDNPLIPDIMKTAIHKVAGPAVRNYGTFCGNLANASGKAAVLWWIWCWTQSSAYDPGALSAW